MKQLSNNKISFECSVQIRTPNFKFIVTRFLWGKFKKPVGSHMAIYEFFK